MWFMCGKEVAESVRLSQVQYIEFKSIIAAHLAKCRSLEKQGLIRIHIFLFSSDFLRFSK